MKLILKKNTDSEIKNSAVKGSVFSFASQFFILVIQFSTTAYLARVLSPDVFGLVAMSLAVSGFIAVFKDLGLSMATVQQEEVTQYQVSNLFWVNLTLSTFFALLTALISPLVVLFFEDERLLNITIVSGIALIIAGLTVQHQAILRRQMRFKELAVVDVFSRMLGSLIVIVWATKTQTYWSLVFLPIFNALFYAIGVWSFSKWVPSVFKKNVGTKSMLLFGRNMTHYGLVNYFARNADNFIIGKVAGPADLGFYSRAYSLMLLPISQLISPLTGVMIAALSRLKKNDEAYKLYYLQVVKLLSFIVFPLVSTMFLLSDQIIEVFLGSQWEESKLIFKILCIAAFWQPILSTTGWVLTSSNQTERIVKWGYINSVLLVAVFLIGSYWGGVGVAAFYAAYMWIVFIPNLSFAFKHTNINNYEVILSLKDSVALTVIYVIISYFIIATIQDSSIWTIIAWQSSFGLVYWLIVFSKNKAMQKALLNMKNQLKG